MPNWLDRLLSRINGRPASRDRRRRSDPGIGFYDAGTLQNSSPDSLSASDVAVPADASFDAAFDGGESGGGGASGDFGGDSGGGDAGGGDGGGGGGD